MKKYKYSEIENYNNIGEIIKEKTVSFGSINEGKVVQITYTETFLSRDVFRVQIMFFKDGKRIDVLNGYVDENELILFLQKNKVIQ